MKNGWVLLLMVGVLGAVTVAPATAGYSDRFDIGSISLFLSSPHDNGALDQDPAPGIIHYSSIPATIPLTVKFSATTAGSKGSNSGVNALFMNLTGTALGDQTGRHMIINPVANRDMGVTSSGGWVGPRGLGFNFLVDSGTDHPLGIFGFGAVQALPDPANFAYLDAQYVGHPEGSHPTVATNGGLPMYRLDQYEAGIGPVTFFTGTAALNPPEINRIGRARIDLLGQGGGALWWYGGSNGVISADYVLVHSAGLTISPEPATVSLLALAGLVVLRRRRG